jgi:sulfur-carrier protein
VSGHNFSRAARTGLIVLKGRDFGSAANAPEKGGALTPEGKMVDPETNSGASIRVVIPQHLRTLAATGAEVTLELAAPITIRRVLDALEARHPVLRGTIREYGTGQRRAFLRFFACEEDWSHESLDAELPEAVADGREPLLIVGAIAGGCAAPLRGTSDDGA